MDFWQAQRKAKRKTKWYVLCFLLLTVAMAAFSEYLLYLYLGDEYSFNFPFFALFFLCTTCGVAWLQYFLYGNGGGGYVARSMGARRVSENTIDPKERQLLNIVEEISIASSLPVPEVYVLDYHQINAFAAGLTKENAAIAVTVGALDRLSRDELQGVIAHEYGHIYNGDMRISLQLSAMLMGFFFILYIAMRLLYFSRFAGRSDKGPPLIFLIAFAFLIAGSISWFFGSILRATVSRQREYLADACAVQFTRNPDGLANALVHIGRETIQDMPALGMAYSHLYFDHRYSFRSIFATHPPLQKRVEAILNESYLPEEWKKTLHEDPSYERRLQQDRNRLHR